MDWHRIAVNDSWIVDTRILQDKVRFPALQKCTGDSGFVQELVARHEHIVQVMHKVGEVAASQAHRGEAYIGLFCNHGFHRSPAVANLVARGLKECGWTVKVQHCSPEYHGRWCECHAGRGRTWCPSVYHRLWTDGDARAEEHSEEAYRDHLEKVDDAFSRAMPMVAEAFARVGFPLR